MAENNKRMILVKGNCENCDKPVGVEVPEPEPVIKLVTEPCKCGLDSDSRTSKHIATAIGTGLVALVLGLAGSCVSNHYFTTQQIRAMKGEFVIQEKGKDYQVGDTPLNSPDFRVVPKAEAPAKR